MSKKICLIFGTAGQDGSLMTRYLLKKNYTVYALYQTKNLNLKELKGKKKLKLIKTNYNDYNKIVKIIKISNCDEIYFFGGKSSPHYSIINFDADLYSSTICALNYSKSIIDKNTILIFDEFLMNESWEEDEFKALNEFCSNNSYSYEVLAVSFFTKQVAVKLVGI